MYNNQQDALPTGSAPEESVCDPPTRQECKPESAPKLVARATPEGGLTVTELGMEHFEPARDVESLIREAYLRGLRDARTVAENMAALQSSATGGADTAEDAATAIPVTATDDAETPAEDSALEIAYADTLSFRPSVWS